MSKAKETTARNPSVGADGGQPSKTYTLSIAETDAEFNENFSDSPDFFQKLQRAQDPDFLNTVSYNELMEETLPSRKAVIDGLLSTGVYLLVGAPKIGKSFLVAQIAYWVSTGTDLWGYRVHGGTVLYLALEDDRKRLQERMARMFGVEGCDSLHFATHAGQVGQNLDKRLQNFLREHPDTVLVIVDTLQKVREMTSEYSYASDYDVISSLKQLADSYNIGFPFIIEKINSDNTLIPKVRAKDNSRGNSFTLPEKHRFTKAVRVSSGLKCFHPIKSRYVGDHAIRLRTTHIITGGGPLRKFCVSDFRQKQEYHMYAVHDEAYSPCPPLSREDGTVCAPLAA